MMLTTATTPTTTPAAIPATFEEPLDCFVGAALDVEAEAGLVIITVLPGPVLVTTVGVCVDVPEEVVSDEDGEDDDDESPPSYVGGLVCSPVK